MLELAALAGKRIVFHVELTKLPHPNLQPDLNAELAMTPLSLLSHRIKMGRQVHDHGLRLQVCRRPRLIARCKNFEKTSFYI